MIIRTTLGPLVLVMAMSSCGTDPSFIESSEGRVVESDEQASSKDVTAKGDNEETSQTDDNFLDLEKINLRDVESILKNPEDNPYVKEMDETCASSETSVVSQVVSFGDPGQVCDWGNGGNGVPQDRSVRARTEQYVDLNIPDGALVCEMTFEFEESSMRYDDEIFLTFNGLILAASQDYSDPVFPDGLGTFGPFRAFDWGAIQFQHYDHNYAPQFCLGDELNMGQCWIPPTETTGTMNLQMDSALVRQIALLGGLDFDGNGGNELDPALVAIASARKNAVGFVTTGDNDGSDCQHSDFEFSVSYRYVSSGVQD